MITTTNTKDGAQVELLNALSDASVALERATHHLADSELALARRVAGDALDRVNSLVVLLDFAFDASEV